MSSLTAYGPGYISEDLKGLEKVVGLQTDKPLKRAFMPYGGIQMAEAVLHHVWLSAKRKNYMRSLPSIIKHITRQYLMFTHQKWKRMRHNKILTGLPDTYGRGRIVGDYRRVALLRY